MGQRWDLMPDDVKSKIEAAERDGSVERKEIVGVTGRIRELVRFKISDRSFAVFELGYGELIRIDLAEWDVVNN